MKSYKALREEVSQKHAVLTYGRMSPPHAGHAKVIDHVLQQPGDHHVVVSHTHDNKKNPLSASQKLEILGHMYPKHKHVFSASDHESPTIFHQAAKLHKKGYTHLTVVTGEDRRQEFHDKLHAYNGKFDDKGNGYHFKKINVVSAGDRDPDSDDVEGMSATKMRDAAVKGDVEGFKKGLHHNIKSDHHAKRIIKMIRNGMGLSDKPDHVREAYLEGSLFHVGQIVSTDEGDAEIIDLGTNYLTLVREGHTFKRWLKDVSLTENQHAKRDQIYKESFIYKGYKTKNFTRDIAEQFREIAKDNKDNFALLNCIICCDHLLDPLVVTENFDSARVDFERANKYLKKFDLRIQEIADVETKLIHYSILEGVKFTSSDKMKVATIIAAAVGIDPTGGNPETIVNAAIKKFKNERHPVDGWKIFGSMLMKARQAGVKWDDSIIAKPTQKAMGITND